MKKFLLAVLSIMLVITLALGATGCKKKKNANTETYTLDTSAFSTTVKYNDQMNLSGLVLVSNTGSRVQVTPDMVSGIDTASIGAKTLTVSYKGQTFNVNYTVKFLVTFVVNGVETHHYVESASELSYPETPEIIGKQFEGWSREIPNVLTGNIVIEANYKYLSNAREEVFTWTGAGTIDVKGYIPAGATYELKVLGEDEAEDSTLADVSLSEAAQQISYTLAGNDTAIIVLKVYDGESLVADKSWEIIKVAKPTLSIGDGTDVVGVPFGDRSSYVRVNYKSDVSFKYIINCNNQNLNVTEATNVLYIETLKAGVTSLSIKAVNDMNPTESIDLSLTVVVTPSALLVTETQNEYGIEGIWTVGSDSIGGTLPALHYSASNAGGGFAENISWITNNSNVTVTNGVITLSGSVTGVSELVEVRARFSYGGVTYDSPAMVVRCVFGGVNVFNYAGLYTETIKSNPRPIILQNNVIDDFSSGNYEWMNTTYDAGYYQNRGEEAKIKVLLQFKNDVYGNGYEINAHNATLGTYDEAGMPTSATLFRGPLNFVAFSMTSSDGAISVKAQDNICFAVHENVLLNNITLRSCKLDPDPTTGKIDLSDLDFVGTTVEVLGDNVVIEYSRINNGRTVLRVFGDVADPTKDIHLTIQNSILSHAREFIIRMGSNCFVTNTTALDGTESPYSPLLPGDTSNEYDNMKNGNYDEMTDEERAAYDAKYIKTYVTVKDSVFEEAGIFAIGIDSHFAGLLLHDASKMFGQIDGFKPWRNLAKTSYGAKLIFEGDVRMYNWKKLSDIDSSTLISNQINDLKGLTDLFGETNAKLIDNLEFNVQAMIKDIITQDPGETSFNPAFKNAVDIIDGVEYVHNGIAFFGGGKNYGVFENNINSVSFNHEFEIYNISFEDVEQAFLRHAAGNEPFFFVIYDATSNFDYTVQQNLKNKYEVVYPK